MGVSIAVTGTYEELEALESEGLPQVHITYGSWRSVLDAYGLRDLDEVVGSAGADTFLERLDRARVAATAAPLRWVVGGGWLNTVADRVEVVAEIATIAKRLGREVTWG